MYELSKLVGLWARGHGPVGSGVRVRGHGYFLNACGGFVGTGLGGGFVHWVEWQTGSPVLINSFNLVASHDGPSNANRAFSTFNLYSWTGAAWDSLYSYAASNPYGGGETYTQLNQLELHDTFFAVTSQRFRAEFVQYNAGDGPRIPYTMPPPAASQPPGLGQALQRPIGDFCVWQAGRLQPRPNGKPADPLERQTSCGGHPALVEAQRAFHRPAHFSLK